MPSSITNKFHVQTAERLLNTFQTTSSENYYLFTGKHTSWVDANNNPVSDDNPPVPASTTLNTDYTTFDQIISGKQVTSADAVLMVPRYNWSAGQVYDAYDDQDPDLLMMKHFFVVNAENGNYNVFKCLSNNNGAASLEPPLLSETSAYDESYIKPVDLYHWKFLYTIPGATFAKFATNDYIPCLPSANVAMFASNGSIDTILLNYGGASYNSYSTGNFVDVAVGGNTYFYGIASSAAANNGFYVGSSIYLNSGVGAGQLRNIINYIISGTEKKIELDNAFNPLPDFNTTYEIGPRVTIMGDGQGATARALVNAASSNSVYSIQMINRGDSYTYANVAVTGNTGLIAMDSNAAIAAVSANCRVIISPPGGHGFDVPNELSAMSIGVSVTLANTENGTIPAYSDYRQVGLIVNPLFAAANVTLANVTSTFAAGEQVTGTTSNSSGYISNITYNGSNVGIIVANVAAAFVANETIIGANSAATGVVASIGTSMLTFDQRTVIGIANTSGTSTLYPFFSQNEFVSQPDTSAYGRIHYANSSVMYLTEVKGNFLSSDNNSGTVYTIQNNSGIVAQVTSVVQPALVKYSGNIVYIEDVQPIARANTQSETLKLVLQYN